MRTILKSISNNSLSCSFTYLRFYIILKLQFKTNIWAWWQQHYVKGAFQI